MQICPSGTGIYTFAPLSEHAGDTTAPPSVAKLLRPTADARHRLDRLVVIPSSAPARSAPPRIIKGAVPRFMAPEADDSQATDYRAAEGANFRFLHLLLVVIMHDLSLVYMLFLRC